MNETIQQVLAEALKQVFELCFEMDEKLFGNYEIKTPVKKSKADKFEALFEEDED